MQIRNFTLQGEKTILMVEQLLTRWLFLILVLSIGCDQLTRQTTRNTKLVLQDCLAPAQKFYASEANSWAENISKIPEIGHERVVAITTFDQDGQLSDGWDARWTTDAWIFGRIGSLPSLLVMPRSQNLQQFREKYFRKADWHSIEVGQPRTERLSRMDAGGNILVSPPVPGKYPFGRIIVGRSLQPSIKNFLRAQQIQVGNEGDLVEIETDWLKVGHVDEVVSFLPTKEYPGFRLVLPDPIGGLRILQDLAPESVLFCGKDFTQIKGKVTDAGARYIEIEPGMLQDENWSYVRIISGRGAGQVGRIRQSNEISKQRVRLMIDVVWDLRNTSPTRAIELARGSRCEKMPIWFDIPDNSSHFVAVTRSRMWIDQTGEEFPAVITAGELVKDTVLLTCTEVCAKRIRFIRDVCIKALGLKAGAEITLPVIIGGNEKGNQAWWLVPNPVNLIQIGNAVVLLDPQCGKQLNNSKEMQIDFFAKEWAEVLQSFRCRAIFVDGWDALHRLDGGARCGTNVLRSQR